MKRDNLESYKQLVIKKTDSVRTRWKYRETKRDARTRPDKIRQRAAGQSDTSFDRRVQRNYFSSSSFLGK